MDQYATRAEAECQHTSNSTEVADSLAAFVTRCMIILYLCSAVKPAEPKNFKCMSYNWESLVCTWEPAQNYLTTRSSLKFFFPGRPGGRAIYQCPVDQSSNSCRLNYTSDPIYRQSQPYYFFRLNISNDLGHHIVSYNFNHWANGEYRRSDESWVRSGYRILYMTVSKN